MVSELIGTKLDYWVARALGFKPYSGPWMMHDEPSRPMLHSDQLGFSTDWAQGGPIIEREGIATYRNYIRDGSGNFNGWIAAFGGRVKPCDYGTGPTPLIAAMRAFVASKYGETLPDA